MRRLRRIDMSIHTSAGPRAGGGFTMQARIPAGPVGTAPIRVLICDAQVLVRDDR
jgi:hypothetical protein